jgi:oxygen-independent coproporphyrinogen-3 oxidase
MRPPELFGRIAAATAATTAVGTTRDLEVYIHIPFCSSKCLFCDWVVEVPTRQLLGGPARRAAYADRLCEQIAFYGPQLTQLGYRPKFIYWGGGTPTRLDADETARIVDTLHDAFDLSGLAQHTLETTPNDLTAEKARMLKRCGIDRVSVGVQSFNALQLRTSGRSHSAEDAVAAVALLRDAGIDNINLDLISGFPGEKREWFDETLRKAIALAPAHITVYSYRATPRTLMAMQIEQGVKAALTVEEMIAAYEYAQTVLAEAGYHEYLYNCFARTPEAHSKVALYGYGLRGETFGFGSGASSIIGHHYLLNEKDNFTGYLEQPFQFDMIVPFDYSQVTVLVDAAGNALMTREGLYFDRFRRLTGCDFERAMTVPGVRGWFRYLVNCGAIFRWEADRVYIDERLIHRVYLTHLYYSNNPAIRHEPGQRRDPAVTPAPAIAASGGGAGA